MNVDRMPNLLKVISDTGCVARIAPIINEQPTITANDRSHGIDRIAYQHTIIWDAPRA